MKLRSMLVFLLVAALLCGCSSPEKTAADTPAEEPAEAPKPTQLRATITNSSGYIFNELYVSPTASNDWGSDLLGSTSVLKKGGSFDITVSAYDFNNYDIRIVDEDDDTYLFERVPLNDNCEIDIIWENELEAVITSGSETTSVTGQLAGDSSSGSSESSTPGWIEMVFENNTNWAFNEIYIFPTGTTDQSQIGYNHIANGTLYQESTCNIGVDWLSSFDILMIDEEGDQWYFQSVVLEQDCYVIISFDGSNAKLSIGYSNSPAASYVGKVQ